MAFFPLAPVDAIGVGGLGSVDDMLVPAQIIRAALALAVVIALGAIFVGSRQPAVDIIIDERAGRVVGLVEGRAQAPVTLVAGARSMPIIPADLARDSDVFQTPVELNRFYVRQTMLADMMQTSGAFLDVAGHRVPIRAHRGPANVGTFWVMLLPGLIALIVSAVVLAASPRSLPNRLVAVTGLAFPFVTAGIAVCTSRDIAINGDLFRHLFLMHEISALTFATAMVALFCVYPVRIMPHRWLGMIGTATGLWCAILVLARWMEWEGPSPNPAVARLMALRDAAGGSQVAACMLLVALCAALVAQFRATRGDPLARAALTWFGLATAVGAGGAVAIVAVPNILGMPMPLDASVGFLMLLLIYAGLTMAVLRYRLFEAKIWGFRVLFATCATALLWLVDAAMIYGLRLDQGPALGLSIIFVGFAYQPMRAWLAARLRPYGSPSGQEMFTTAIEAAFAPPAIRVDRWRAMMQRTFEPLEICHDDVAGAAAPMIVEEGLTMVVPDPVSGPALRISYPGQGKRLFAPADLALVEEMASLCRQAATALQSYDRGAADERQRMAQDLHDDVGARLLSGIHIAQGPVRVLLQDALRDIRALVTGLIGETAPLARVIADIRHETASRLEAAGIALDWPILSGDREDRLVPYPLSKAITSILREAVSNTIRHSGATCMTVRIVLTASGGTIHVQDDGRGFAPDGLRGNGLNGIAARMAQIGGTFTLTDCAAATRLTMAFPLAGSSSPPIPPEQQHA